jgi:cytochrome c biogenesis protein CcmG/thiol:disulfide interchange protein DsbE
MLKATVSTALTAFLASTLFLPVSAQQAPSPLPAGSPAPAFTTKTLAGQSISLKSLRGKVVLLDVWATWCPPCRAATPMLQSLHQKFGSKGLQVVGLSVDDESSVGHIPAFKKQFKVTYTLSANPQGNQKIGQAYNAQGIPSIYLIDQKGVVRWSQSGYDSESEEQLLTQKIKELLSSNLSAKAALKTAHR